MAKRGDKEREEALWRLLILIISGIIISVWGHLIVIISIVHFFMVLITGKRNKSIADFCEIWNSEAYRFVRYISFESNERPFPFNPLKLIGKFEK